MSNVRVSVAALACSFRSHYRGKLEYLTVLNARKWNEGGQKSWQAFGGGIKFTESGQRAVEEHFGGYDFSSNADVRFYMPEVHVEAFLQTIQEYTETWEEGMRRELSDELCNPELRDIPPMLTPEETDDMRLDFVKVCKQPVLTGKDSSFRATDVPTIRLFGIFDVQIHEQALSKIRSSEGVCALSVSELQTTKGGTQAGVTVNNEPIANNVWQY